MEVITEMSRADFITTRKTFLSLSVETTKSLNGS